MTPTMNWADCLKTLEPQVESYRSSYLDSISVLPQPISSCARSHLKDRIRRAAPRPLLGEFAPLLIGDILGITSIDQESLRSTVISWLHIYYAVMMIDDALDTTDDTYGRDEVITGAFLLQRGLNLLLAGPPERRHHSRQQILDQVLARNAVAALHEVRRKTESGDALSSQDIANTTDKLAVLHICVDAIVDLVQTKKERTLWLHSAIEHFAFGIQLLDDLTDWEEDLRDGSKTMPLCFAAAREATPLCKNSRPRGRNQNFIILTTTRSFQDTIETALAALQKTITTIRENTDVQSATTQYLEVLCRCGHYVVCELDSIRELTRAACIRTSSADGLCSLDGLTDEELESIARRVRHVLSTVAQGS